MKLIITCNTWVEEVRNATIHVLQDDLTLLKFKTYTEAIAKAIADNQLEKATNMLRTFSKKGYEQERLRDLINDLRGVYEQAN